MLEGELNFIESAKRGDSSAFGALYDHYLAQIYRFIYLKVGGKHEAEDLAHEVFMSAWQNLPGYTDKGFPFSSWLYQIARNKVIDHFRTKKHALPLDAAEEESAELASISENNLDIALKMGVVKAALRELPEEHQSVLIMRFVEDLPSKEIAEILGKSEGAVRLIQHRALIELKKLLGEDGSQTTTEV